MATAITEARKDSLRAVARLPQVREGLRDTTLVVTGGTGFLGTWLAETIAALNDEYGLQVKLQLVARETGMWAKRYPHLSGRSDVVLQSQDVRSPIEFTADTNYVIHAAGLPNRRIHASDPLRVAETTLQGISSVLHAATHLRDIRRLINISSCLVNGSPVIEGPISESDTFPFRAGNLSNVYADAKRGAESIAAAYRSQHRIPVSTVRPFAWIGAYQDVNSPLAIHGFIRDALGGGDIRIHGNGMARRSYIHGSDAAAWTLAAATLGTDGDFYNVGNPEPISHLELANLVKTACRSRSAIATNTVAGAARSTDDLYPRIDHTTASLGVSITTSTERAVDACVNWARELSS